MGRQQEVELGFPKPVDELVETAGKVEKGGKAAQAVAQELVLCEFRWVDLREQMMSRSQHQERLSKEQGLPQKNICKIS